MPSGDRVRAACWAAFLSGAEAASGVVDFDAVTPSIITYSKEHLRPSPDVPDGFFPVGDTRGQGLLLTRAEIGKAGRLVLAGRAWIRYDINESLAFRGVAPRLFVRMQGSDGTLVDLVDGGATAANESTFLLDRYLLYPFDPALPPDLRTPSPSTRLEVDLGNVLATSGAGDGVVRVRAFEEVLDAVRGQGALGLDKQRPVLKVARSLRIIAETMKQRAKAASGFLRFAVGGRVPLGGVEVSVAVDHREPNGELVGQTLEGFNVDVDASTVSFSSDGGFAFAPVKDGWTVEQVDPRTGLCHGDREAAAGDLNADPPKAPDRMRAVHSVSFGMGDVFYPAGPVMTAVRLGTWYLCAAVSADNAQIIPEADYWVTVTLAPRVGSRPFPPRGLEDALLGSVWRDGTTVHVPYLTSSAGHAQELIVVNRHRRLIDYVLVVQAEGVSVGTGVAIPGKLARSGPTHLRVAELAPLGPTQRGTAMLAVVSFPEMIDVATTIVNQADGSTDTVVLHRGLHDRAAPQPDHSPNRTTVHVPLVTTSAATVQRLTIVNRLLRRVSWSLMLHPEGDATATPEVVRGTIGLRASTTLRMRDLVTLAGGDRAAATLVLAAKPAYFDVSTTFVNRMDGATDTVILHRGNDDSPAARRE